MNILFFAVKEIHSSLLICLLYSPPALFSELLSATTSYNKERKGSILMGSCPEEALQALRLHIPDATSVTFTLRPFVPSSSSKNIHQALSTEASFPEI
jgi:hypothetical protein